MQRSMHHSLARSFPPMHRWPRPVKIAIIGAGALVCLAAYGALLSGILSFLSLLLAEA
jgi:hypothetical protein